MASFDRSIPPGGKGKITITVNTKGYRGSIHKTALVHTNDPKMPKLQIGVKAFVRVPILVSTRNVLLRPIGDQSAAKTVRIVAGFDKPLVIETEAFNLEGKVAYQIKEEKKNHSYLIDFTTLPENRGMVDGFLKLKTNYEEAPMIEIRVRARFPLVKAKEQE